MIQELKLDKEALCARLERMERRLNNLRAKADETSNIVQESGAHCETVKYNKQFKASDSSQKRKRKSSFSSVEDYDVNTRNRFGMVCQSKSKNVQSLSHQEQQSVDKGTKGKLPKHTARPRHTGMPMHKYRSTESLDESACLPEDKTPVKKIETTSALYCSREVRRTRSQAERLKGVDGILRTRTEYYMNSPPLCLDIPSVPTDAEDDTSLETPGWRIHPIASAYTLEGTENLDDIIFDKRHQKSETDEKRRKRWDMQRLREQKVYEKLKEGRLYGKKRRKSEEQDEDMPSFFPDPEKLQYIEVTEKLPVVAFGHPVPYVNDEDFTLDWFSLDAYEKQKQKIVRLNKRKR